MKKIFLTLATLLCIIAPASASWSDYTIILDPGHGGDDPGACQASSGVDNYTESWLVWKCAGKVHDELQRLGANVIMTRYDDYFSGEVDLSPRRAYCYTYNSDVFVSFHLNAANATAHGTETWYYYDGSYNLALYIQSALMSDTGFAGVDGAGGYEMIDRGIKNNGWTVITAGEAYPAVLTEGLFIDCYSDWQLIQDTKSRGFYAWVDGHLKGIYDYLNYCGGYAVSEPRYYAANSSGGGGGGGIESTPYISVSSNKVQLTCVAGSTATAEVVLDGNLLNRWTTVTLNNKAKDVFSVSPEGLNVSGDTHDFDPANPKVTITFKPTAVGTYSGDDYYITFESIDINGNVVNQWIHLTGVATAPELSFTEKWNYSDKNNNLTEAGWDASKVRNMDHYNSKLFMVYEQSMIKVVDARTGEYLYDLGTTGVEGGMIKLCDVRAFDNKIVGCNIGGLSGTNEYALRIYVWEDKANSTPTVTEIPYSVLSANNILRLGDYVEVGGSWDSGRLIFAHDNYGRIDGITGGTYIVEFPISNGTIGTTPTIVNVTTDGSTYLPTKSSIRVYPTWTGYMLDSKDSQPTKLSPGGTREDYINGYNRWGNCCRQFTYNGNDYALISSFNEMTYSGTDTDGDQIQTEADITKNYTGGHMKLLNVTENESTGSSFYSPLFIADYPQAHLSDNVRNTNCTGNVLVNQDGDNYVEAWVLSTGQGIAYFSSGNVPESGTDPNPNPNPGEDINIDKLTEVWNYSVTKGNLDEATWFSSSVDPISRNMTYNNGKLYVLNAKPWNEAPTISILNAYTGEFSTSLSTTGILTGGTAIASSLATLGGKILLANSGSAYAGVRVYKWENDNSDPVLWFEDSNTKMRLDVMSVSGDMNNGRIWFSDATNVYYYTVNNGVVNTTANTIALGSALTNQNGANDIVYNTDGTFWVNPQYSYPVRYSADGKTQLETFDYNSYKGYSNGRSLKIIEYGNKTYMADVTYIAEEGTSTNNNGAMTFTEITNGITEASHIGVYPSVGLGDKSNTIGLSSISYEVTDNNDLNIWVMVPNQGIAMYQHKRTTTSIEEPIVKDENAPLEFYNLQGLKVNSENLLPGIYIRRQGSTVTKILVR